MFRKLDLVAPPGAVRLLLAAMVVLSHMSRFEIGRLAVLLFFVLSGYWVTILWESKFGKGRLLAFYGSRYFRIVPLYLIALTVFSLLLQMPIWPINLVLLGVASQGHDPLGVSWSLDVELQFYLCLPLIVWLARRNGPILLAVVTAAATLLGWYLGLVFDVWIVGAYLPAFLIGVMGAVTKYNPRRTTGLVSLAAFAAFTMVLVLMPWTRGQLDNNTPNHINHDLFAFVWMLPIVPYIFASVAIPSGKMDRHLGNLSYSLYLVHFPIISLVKKVLPWDAPVKLLAIGLSVAAAVALYVFVDRRIDPMRQQIFEPRRMKEKLG